MQHRRRSSHVILIVGQVSASDRILKEFYQSKDLHANGTVHVNASCKVGTTVEGYCDRGKVTQREVSIDPIHKVHVNVMGHHKGFFNRK